MSFQDVYEFYVEQDDSEYKIFCPHCNGCQTWTDWLDLNDDDNLLARCVYCEAVYRVCEPDEPSTAAEATDAAYGQAQDWYAEMEARNADANDLRETENCARF